MKCFGQKIRNYHCKVVLLDDQELIQEIQSTSVGQELLENIFKHLNLIETAYFGLRFIDNTGQTHWLDPGKKVVKQLEGTEPFTLYFGVKFYATDPCKLLEEITRYQYFLQIKQDILQGRLPVPCELTPELCAYVVQSELGDYDPRRHCSGYISEFRFIANQSPELENSISELHKTMAGQVPAVAELNYLEKVKWLDMYGVDLHPVLGEDNVDYFLGLTPSGVIVLRNKTKVGNYFWPRIYKMTQKGKYFMLRARNKTNEEQTYGFETPSKSACKHLWRCAMEHNAFFRLVQVAPSGPNSGSQIKSYSLNSRFRNSARSDSSVRRRSQPEFVRTPSRRYQRRVVEGAQDAPETQDPNKSSDTCGPTSGFGVTKTIAIPQPVQTSDAHHTSMQSIPRITDSPRSTRSAPWPAPNSGGSKYLAPSPKSVRSAGVGSSNNHHERDRRHKRSASAESNSSCESKSHRRHRHRGRSKRNSDAESEVSRSSGKSHGKRHHKSGSSSRKGDSGSESENCRHRHRHRHRHSTKYELVDSEVQWREAQKKQQASKTQGGVQQVSVIRDLGSLPISKQPIGNNEMTTPSIRKSGYTNSGLETESEISYHNRRRHRKSHRSTSPDKRLPTELKRHLDFKLIDTEGMTEEQLRQIPYKTVETNNTKSSKVRYNSSVKSNRTPYANRDNNTDNSSPDIIKPEAPGCGDSPPPPYSPPSANIAMPLEATTGDNHKPPLPQKPNVNSPRNSLENSMSPANKIIPKSPMIGNSSLSSRPNGNTHLTPSNQFSLPPPPPPVKPHKVPHAQVYGNRSGSGLRLASSSHNDDLGIHDINHPSPSESPDSQKVDSHHENSDSGLGTDHQEYYRTENFSSLSYGLPRNTTNGLSTKQFSQNGGEKIYDWKESGRQMGSENRFNLDNSTRQKYWETLPDPVLKSQQSRFSCHTATGSLRREISTRSLEKRAQSHAQFYEEQRKGGGSSTLTLPARHSRIAYDPTNESGGYDCGGFGRRGSKARASTSSLEIILSPLLTSRRTRM